MTTKTILPHIAKAIREGKYLHIAYKNKNDEVTRFWISILDINANDELRVNMFNATMGEQVLDGKIYISRILSAEILKFSHYPVSDALIRKIDEDVKTRKKIVILAHAGRHRKNMVI